MISFHTTTAERNPDLTVIYQFKWMLTNLYITVKNSSLKVMLLFDMSIYWIF